MSEIQKTCNLNFSVKGMQCASCELILEESINKIAGVEKVKVSLNSKQVQVKVSEKASSEEIMQKVNDDLKNKGYSLETMNSQSPFNWEEMIYALAISLVFVVVFVALQFAGLNKLIDGQMNFGLAFLVGIIASVSTCMALTGGILLSLSATHSKMSNPKISQLSFHLSRLVTFAVLGGITGFLGSILNFSSSFDLFLKILLFFLMLIIGLNLLEIFPFLKKFEPRMPKFISKIAYEQSQKAINSSSLDSSNINSFKNLFLANLTPILVGALTFFLPCGFTQSIQLFVLSTKSFWEGSLLMTGFALGTLPVLSLVSFGSLNFSKNKYKGLFFKTSGFLLIAFALLNLLNILSLLGLIPPVLNGF